MATVAIVRGMTNMKPSTKAAHTAGPWKYIQGANQSFGGQMNKKQAQLEAMAHIYEKAIAGLTDIIKKLKADRDALLEALKNTWCASIDDDHVIGGSENPSCPVCAIARAAIAQAEGK